jgi:hypothetical protein
MNTIIVDAAVTFVSELKELSTGTGENEKLTNQANLSFTDEGHAYQITAWENAAVNLVQAGIQKGDKIYIKGHLVPGVYMDKKTPPQGHENNKIDIIEKMYFAKMVPGPDGLPPTMGEWVEVILDSGKIENGDTREFTDRKGQKQKEKVF